MKRERMRELMERCEEVFLSRSKWYGTLHDTIREELSDEYTPAEIEAGIKEWTEKYK